MARATIVIDDIDDPDFPVRVQVIGNSSEPTMALEIALAMAQRFVNACREAEKVKNKETVN